MNFTHARWGSRRPAILLLQEKYCISVSGSTETSRALTVQRLLPTPSALHLPEPRASVAEVWEEPVFSLGEAANLPWDWQKTIRALMHPQQGSNCKISWGEILAPMETRGNSLWFTWGLACCPQPWALLDCKIYHLSMVGKKIFPAVRIISCLCAVSPGGRSQSCSGGCSTSLGKGRLKKRGEGRKEGKKKKTFTVAKTSLKIWSAP